MLITSSFLSLGKKARGGVNDTAKPVYFSKPVDLIIIHWIGSFPHQTPSIVRNWWENGTDGTGVQASAHFIVKGKEVLQTLPINEAGWHSGDMRNWGSIGIEVIPMDSKGEFSTETINTLKELVAHIRIFYPKARLERHFDGVQKKNCPDWYTPYVEGGDERWVALRNFLDGVEGENA